MKQMLSKFCIPQRYVIAIMSFFCVCINYILRVALNITLTQMVPPSENENKPDPFACPDPNSGNSTSGSEIPTEVFEWSELTQAVILSAFYYGYMVTHIPAGILSEKYGAKHVMGFGILITTVLTLATPPLVRWGGAPALITVRVIEGLGEGPTMPALAALMARWIPKEERGFLGAVVFGGAQLGNILGNTLSGVILSGEEKKWANVFYWYGGAGLVFYFFWLLLVYSEPKTSPLISDEEKEYLQKAIEEKPKLPVPWGPLFTSLPVWAIVIAAIGHDWGYYTIVTDLPKYMVNVLKFDIMKTGFLASVPYLVMLISSFIFGFICDFFVKRGIIGVGAARKIFTTIASMGPAAFIVAASYAGCDTDIVVLMFTLAMMLMGAYYCGMKVNALDITPNYAGTATALINGIATISGIITPYIVAAVAPDQWKDQWQTVFWIVFGVFAVTNIFYVLFATGEEQWWNNIEKNGIPENSMWNKNKGKSIELTNGTKKSKEVME